MKLAVCLYKYFPFGGLARDFLRIMTICRDRGYKIDVFVMEWQGEIPHGFNVQVVPTRGFTNHGKVASYIDQISPQLINSNYDLIIGFNKIPELDLYYAADPCYLDRVKNQKGYFFHRLGKRFRFYAKCERSVFGIENKTVALMISDSQKDLFQQHYKTPNERLIMLPPGIDQNRRRPKDWLDKRQEFRQEFNINNDQFIILLVGTGFKTKGVGRAIQAFSSLPENLLKKSHLFIVGEGDPDIYKSILNKYSIKNKVRFLGGRNDVPRFLLGADLLVHPARKENTGTVILEAIVAGLPVLVTAVCGYAKHVEISNSGSLIASPFDQNDFDQKLSKILDFDLLTQYSKNALKYAESEDLYSMPEQVVEIIKNMASKS